MIKEDMNLALVAIGIPGAGKSTHLRPFAAEHGFVYVNKDELREEILGDATDQSRNKEIWEEANRRIAAALRERKGVVIDGTNVEAWKRRETIDFLRESGATHVIGVYADIPLELAKEQNMMRERVVPEEALEWMHMQLTKAPPSLEEGFDALISPEELADFGRTL
ncbi:MAG: ATP-binding protein [Patescibacteria group bacterium]